MNNRRVMKQKNKPRIRKGFKYSKINNRKKDKQLNQCEKVLMATKIKYQKIKNENKKLIDELEKYIKIKNKKNLIEKNLKLKEYLKKSKAKTKT